MAGAAPPYENVHVVFSFKPQGNGKKSTVVSYNLISYHFHTKFKDKQPENKTNFKLNRKRKNKLTNGHGGVIIQLRAAIFERIRNAQNKGCTNCFHFSPVSDVFKRSSSLIPALLL